MHDPQAQRYPRHSQHLRPITPSPAPSGVNPREAILPEKDVDGFPFPKIWRLVKNSARLVLCTPGRIPGSLHREKLDPRVNVFLRRAITAEITYRGEGVIEQKRV